MRCRHDTPPEAAGILRAKNMAHGCTALTNCISSWEKQHNRGQEGAGLACVKLGSQSRRRIHVPRTGIRFGSHYGDIRHCTWPLQESYPRATTRCRLCKEMFTLCGRSLYGGICAIARRVNLALSYVHPFLRKKQLEGKEPGSLRQLQT